MNMKRHLLIMVLLPVLAAAQKVPAPYETGMWPGFRSAAVSFTFDDGCRNQFEKAVPLFNEFGYHLTLYTVTRSAGMGLPDWKKLQEAADAGHEIGAHTLTHTSFAELNDSLQTLELRDCRGDIESNLRGVRCLTMAYPFCVTGNKSLVAQYYLAARICSGSIAARLDRRQFDHLRRSGERKDGAGFHQPLQRRRQAEGMVRFPSSRRGQRRRLVADFFRRAAQHPGVSEGT